MQLVIINLQLFIPTKPTNTLFQNHSKFRNLSFCVLTRKSKDFRYIASPVFCNFESIIHYAQNTFFQLKPQNLYHGKKKKKRSYIEVYKC